MTIRPRLSIEYSYSFQWGNACREAFLKPWLLPILPLMFWRGHQKIKRYRLKNDSETPIFFIVDYHKFTSADRMQFQTFLNSLTEAEMLVIGDESVEGATHHYPSPKNSSKSNRDWNEDLQRMLTVIVSTIKPEKMMFIGQYPYSGVMGTFKSIGPKKDTAWLALRPKQSTLDDRSNAFGHVLFWPTKQSQERTLIEDEIYISDRIEEDIRKKLLAYVEKFGLVQGHHATAKTHILSASDNLNHDVRESGGLFVTVFGPNQDPPRPICDPAIELNMSWSNVQHFEEQIEQFMLAISEKRFSGPKIPMVDERAWMDLYSSF